MPADRNLLLASLPPTLSRALLAQMDDVQLAFGDILHEAGVAMRHVYFPRTALVSLLTVADASPLEVAKVGREGMVGVGVALGVVRARMRALVQTGGTALRMDSARFGEAMEQDAVLRKAVLAYVDSLVGQVSRTAACNRYHRVEARLAHWLLTTRDRARSSELEMTQEFLSNMLGVRRVGVSEAAAGFQRGGLIEYVRGRIRILDHAGLEAACCSCYAAEPGRLPAWRPTPARQPPRP
jgi:CRP-like cAMP-binding protein